jgi:DNA repair protein RadC
MSPQAGGDLAEAPVDPKLYVIRAPRVKDLPEEQRPRERFDRLGPENVSDQVLLALLLRHGTAGKNVMDLASELLQEYGSLTGLAQVSADEIAKTRGIGRVKAQILKAALELGRRLSHEAMPAQPVVRTPEDAVRLIRDKARVREEEVFWVLLLDRRYRLRRPPVEVTRGILDASLVHPREVFKEAVRSSSAAVVVVHNHPTGDVQPSAEDLRVTRQIVEAGKIVGIEVLDHVIVGRPGPDQSRDHFSLRESGLVKFED